MTNNFQQLRVDFLRNLSGCAGYDFRQILRVTFMRIIILAILALGLFVSLGRQADAADLSRYSYRSHSQVWHGGDCCGRDERLGPGIRVAEQVPYCGDCDRLVGPNTYHAALSYIGYLPWTRGCALGGCYGYYASYGGCYWKEVPIADGRGGWVRGVEKICN
jgi:hypothetical protein